MNEYILKNYIDDKGKEPVKIWLKDGNFGDYKQLNKYLYELRFDIGAGYRIYYMIENETIVLLINGGDKKSQLKDIKKATEILNKLKGI